MLLKSLLLTTLLGLVAARASPFAEADAKIQGDCAASGLGCQLGNGNVYVCDYGGVSFLPRLLFDEIRWDLILC